MTALGSYESRRASDRNGCKSDGAFGAIHVDSDTSAELSFCFEDPNGNGVTLPAFFFNVYDIDTSRTVNRAVESLRVRGYATYAIADDSDVAVSGDGDAFTFTASMYGIGADNPTDPSALTELQRRRSVAFVFADTDCFTPVSYTHLTLPTICSV